MSTIKKLWFSGNRVFIETNKTEILSRPLEAFPRLKEATKKQRESFQIGSDKTDIRWEEIDEDIHINSFFEKQEPVANNPIAKALQEFPQLNISAFAAQLGINKSLMARYIYGIKTPGPERKKEIENGLHSLGKKLMAVKL